MKTQEILTIAEELAKIEDVLKELNKKEWELRNKRNERFDKIASWAKEANDSKILETLKGCKDPKIYEVINHVLTRVLTSKRYMKILSEWVKEVIPTDS